MKRLTCALVIPCLLMAGCAGYDLETINRALEGPLDSETVAAGLKEALRIGTERSTGGAFDIERRAVLPKNGAALPLLSWQMPVVMTSGRQHLICC